MIIRITDTQTYEIEADSYTEAEELLGIRNREGWVGYSPSPKRTHEVSHVLPPYEGETPVWFFWGEYNRPNTGFNETKKSDYQKGFEKGQRLKKYIDELKPSADYQFGYTEGHAGMRNRENL